MIPYSKDYYISRSSDVMKDASILVPILIDLFQPDSVIDVGCACGEWLSVFKEKGIDNVYGVDSNWIDKSLLRIPVEQFLSHDLSKSLNIENVFDLVLCLEVAEHLPLTSSDVLINSLIRLGPVIVFSAAIPYQGGYHHINEQWQSFWADKFRAKGYIVIDCLRELLWNQPISFWYSQNFLIFVDQEFFQYIQSHHLIFKRNYVLPISFVHPEMLATVVSRYEEYIQELEQKSLINSSIRKIIVVLLFKAKTKIINNIKNIFVFLIIQTWNIRA